LLQSIPISLTSMAAPALVKIERRKKHL